MSEGSEVRHLPLQRANQMPEIAHLLSKHRHIIVERHIFSGNVLHRQKELPLLVDVVHEQRIARI